MAVCDFSDQPRLICFCPEHTQWRAQAIAVKNVIPRVIEETATVEEQRLYDTFDWDDLDNSEHNFMAEEEFLTTVKAQHRDQLPLKPLALSGPKRQEWVKPRNVKGNGKAKGVECEVCKEYPRRPEFFVCDHCQADVEAMVKNLPALMIELDVKVERMDRTHSGNRVVDPEALTPWDKKLSGVFLDQGVWHSIESDDPMRASDAVLECSKALAVADYTKRGYAMGAERAQQALDDQVCRIVLVVADKGMDMVGSRVWLAEHLPSLWLHPTAPKLIGGLKRAYSRAMSQIDNVAIGVLLGNCEGDVQEGRPCQAALYASLPKHEGDPTEVTCPRPSCGRAYSITALWDTKNARLDDALMSVTEIADLSQQDSHIFGGSFKEPVVRYWIKQGWLQRSGSRPNPGKEDTAMYPVVKAKELGKEKFSKVKYTRAA